MADDNGGARGVFRWLIGQVWGIMIGILGTVVVEFIIRHWGT